MMYQTIISKKAQQTFHVATFIYSNCKWPQISTCQSQCYTAFQRRQSSSQVSAKYDTIGTTFSQNTQKVPFYGLPQKPGRKPTSSISSLLHLGTSLKNLLPQSSTQGPTVTEFIQQAMIAIRDPTRADAVAAVGEMTGRHQLLQLVQTMQQHPVGQQILRERPIVSKATIPYDHLIEQAQLLKKQYGMIANIPDDELTFGVAYGLFLLKHGFDPDERDDVKYLKSPADEEIAYVMLRYRQCHDYWHVLTELPPTVNGEIGLKLLELFHMNMPVAALSCMSQSAVILSNAPAGMLFHNNSNNPSNSTNATTGSTCTDDLHTIWNLYLPWARQQARGMQAANVSLLNVYYEHELALPLHILRHQLQLQPFKPS